MIEIAQMERICDICLINENKQIRTNYYITEKKTMFCK